MTHEAFLLLTLPDVELTAPGVRERGTLELECLTVPAAPTARDVFLVLKLGRYETVIDPERHVTVSTTIPTERTYHLHGTPVDPNAITIRVLAGEKSGDTLRAADIETFDAILEQYASFTPGAPHAERTDSGAAYHLSDGKEDLRGRLVLVDQDNGEVLGTVGDSRTAIHEDPSITRRGHEHEPVVIDVGPGGELESARDIFVRAIPEREQTMMTRGASMLSTGISGATTLITNGMTAASNMYISRATPHPSARGRALDGTPPPPPPRAVTWLTSDSTRNGLRTAHTYTGKAVQVSSKTVAMVESLIARAVGGTPSTRPKKRQALADIPTPSPGHTPPPPPPRPRLDTQATIRPDGYAFDYGNLKSSPESMSGNYPYNTYQSKQPSFADSSYPSSTVYNHSPNSSTSSLVPPPTYSGGGPPLPPRKGGKGRDLSPASAMRSYSPSPGPSPISRGHSPAPSHVDKNDNSGSSSRIGTKDRAVLSAHLILSTIDDSARRLIEVGSDSITRVVGHKYGEEAAHSTRILTGTARNVGLVYVDVTGLGRRALIKTAGKQWIKARVKGKKMELRTDEKGQVVQAQPLEK